MKILITGHTSGLGKFLFDKFTEDGNTVIGVSRSEGTDLNQEVDTVVNIALGQDLVIINANAGQAELVQQLAKKVKLVVMGSIAGKYDQLIQSDYSRSKKLLAEQCQSLSLDPQVQLLHLTISMLEDAVSTDKGISFDKIHQTISDWLNNSCYNNIDFDFKLTPFTLEQIKSKFGATQESIDRILQNVCDRTKTQILPTA